MTNFEKWVYYTKDFESPDIYIRWGFYHLIASALQRRVFFNPDGDTGMPGSNSLFCNNFVVLVGPPATGKGRVIKQVIAALTHPVMNIPQADGKLKPLVYTSPKKVTCEKLIDILSRAVGTAEWSRPKADGSGEEKVRTGHVSCSFNIEELEVLFASNAADMVSLVQDAYDCGEVSYATRHQSNVCVKNTCVNIIAGTTTDSIRDLFADKVITKGFTSRVIPVYASEPRFRRIFLGVNEDQRLAFLEIVGHLRKLALSVAGPIKFSPESLERMTKIYESDEKGRSEMFDGRINRDPSLLHYYGRKNIHWQKLAAIIHFSEDASGNMEIPLSCVMQAYKQLSEVEVMMHEAYRSGGRNELFEHGKNIIAFLEERKEARYKSLWFKFSNDMRQEELNECLTYLMGTDQINNTNSQTNEITHGIYVPNGKQYNTIMQQPTIN